MPRDSIVAQLNMDMVGRGGARADEPGGGAGLPAAHRLAASVDGARRSRRDGEQDGDARRSSSTISSTPTATRSSIYCRSDHYEYARYGIPITFFTTGGHRDYHQVTDEPQYIDYAQLARVAKLVHDVAARVANLDHRIVVDKPKPDPKGQCRQ